MIHLNTSHNSYHHRDTRLNLFRNVNINIFWTKIYTSSKTVWVCSSHSNLTSLQNTYPRMQNLANNGRKNVVRNSSRFTHHKEQIINLSTIYRYRPPRTHKPCRPRSEIFPNFPIPIYTNLYILDYIRRTYKISTKLDLVDIL